MPIYVLEIVDGLSIYGTKILNWRTQEMSLTIEKANLEKQELLKECQQLLIKIANHRYSLKLLISAKNALQIIANYKPQNRRKRNGKSTTSAE